MDSVRLGRALGFGARAAAKTLMTAVDAATSPNPSAGARPAQVSPATANSTVTAEKSPPPREGLGTKTVKAAAQVRQTGAGLKRGSKRFGEAVWGPAVRLSGVLWLEFTGVFFGIFALFASLGTWKLRGALHRTPTNHDAHMHLLGAAAMAAIFGYFCISSFVNASRRGRKR